MLISPNTSVSNEEQPPSVSSQHVQCQRKRLAWMRDYVSGDELSDEDTISHFILFVDRDPIAFEDAVKDLKWKEAMVVEIEAIKKNDT